MGYRNQLNIVYKSIKCSIKDQLNLLHVVFISVNKPEMVNN